MPSYSCTYFSPSVTSVISSTTFWGSRMPPFFCTMTVFIVTPLGSFCGHSKWRAKATSRCRMVTMSLSCIPGEKIPSQYKVRLSFTDTRLKKIDISSLHQFSLSLRKALAFYVKSICLTGKLSMAPFSVQFFVLLTIIRFKFLFNLYKSSFRQTNAKFLSVCQYRQIHR